ncbi:MAG: NDP-sugar pyrophosphorylase family protein [Cyclobacteriaceae bacterium]|jgi:NDP-sugar pyrophosphorylase family protein
MKPSLVVLAAGMGSRYGGIKQLDGFGPSQERIIDYTVYDAIEAGFGKIVFVIRKAIEEPFNEAILSRWSDRIDCRVVFQELDALPEGYSVPEGRKKPWGTAHAVWMAEPELQEPFAIVNADDFYGLGSLTAAAEYLSKVSANGKSACMIGYQLGNTLTEAGSVSRGVCMASEEGNLVSIQEYTKISRDASGIYDEAGGQKVSLEENTIVSMNLMGFTPAVFEEISTGFDATYQASQKNLKQEYYIPSVLNAWIQQGVKVPLINTEDQWFGVTYSEDKEWVSEQLAKLHEQGSYPKKL